MTRLRKMMLEELERRNYSEATTRCYIRTVEDFSRRFKRSPDCLGPEHIREYQAELFKKRKLSPGTVTQRFGALFIMAISISLRIPANCGMTIYCVILTRDSK
jgi:integrase/recombinase XerD